MSAPPRIYVLDTNVFVQAHRRHYGFDICPGFWNFVLHEHGAGRLISIDRIRDEITAGDEDALETWASSTAPETLFASTAESNVVDSFAKIMQWVQTHIQFQSEAKEQFARVADGWLVAYAMAHPGHVVVTLEEYSADVKRRVPLPNVCKHFGVPYIDPFTMLRELKARFDWTDPGA